MSVMTRMLKIVPLIQDDVPRPWDKQGRGTGLPRDQGGRPRLR